MHAMNLWAVVLVLLFLNAAFAQDKQRTPFTDRGMEGSGTHCAGDLIIHPDVLTWTTVYSECRDVPYKTVEFKQNGDDLHAVYRLETKNPECKFSILVLDHTGTYIKGRGKGWNAYGYGSWKGYRNNDIADRLGCHLF
jgi:hypothetical protein